jgi:hypothetical protein
MPEEITIQSTVTPAIKLVINGVDAAGKPTSTVWKVCFDYRAIAKCEAATGKDLKSIMAWQNIKSGTDFPQIVHAGLNRYNPDVTLDQVTDALNPQAQTLLSDAIFDMLFPGVREAWKASEAKSETESPNALKAETQTASKTRQKHG